MKVCWIEPSVCTFKISVWSNFCLLWWVGGCRVIAADIHLYPPGKAANVENAWPWFSMVVHRRHHETTWTGTEATRRTAIYHPFRTNSCWGSPAGLVARSQPEGPEGGEPLGPWASGWRGTPSRGWGARKIGKGGERKERRRGKKAAGEQPGWSITHINSSLCFSSVNSAKSQRKHDD